MEEVLESVDFFISNFSILYPSTDSFEIFRKLLKKYKPKGNKIHDLEIVSLAITNGLEEIKTYNEKDFKKISEIKIVRP